MGVLGMSLLDPANHLLISAKFRIFNGDWAKRLAIARFAISGARPAAFQREGINEAALPYKKL